MRWSKAKAPVTTEHLRLEACPAQLRQQLLSGIKVQPMSFFRTPVEAAHAAKADDATLQKFALGLFADLQQDRPILPFRITSLWLAGRDLPGLYNIEHEYASGP